jgi:hypothetical protein
MTADCLPILLCEKQASVVAAIHAGWRGLAYGVIANTLARLPVANDQLMAWIGPSLSHKHFVVDQAFVDHFTEYQPEASNCFYQDNNRIWHGDLAAIAKQQLHRLQTASVYSSGHCSYEDAETFYSYRRDQPYTGRMASLIYLAE